MLETLLKPNTGASLSGCVRWTQPIDGVRVCDFDCALTVPPALPAEPSEVPCEVLFCRQGGLRLTMTDGRQVFLQGHEVLLLLGASVQSLRSRTDCSAVSWCSSSRAQRHRAV